MSRLTNNALRALHLRGREAWPGLELDLATFSSLAGDRLGEGPWQDVRAGELYLAVACAARIERAIALLDEHYLLGLTAALVRRGQDPATAADVLQTVRMRFLVGEPGRCPRIAEYNGRGSLASWLRVAAVRTAISAHRKRRCETAADDIELIATAPSPDLELLRRRFGVEFKSAFRAAFERLTPAERNLLRYQLIDQLGIDRIAALHGVHRATAARWVAHAREALLAGVRCALHDALGMEPREIDSLLEQLRSDLELSARMFLTPSPTCAQQS